jgi:hypothetical protein
MGTDVSCVERCCVLVFSDVTLCSLVASNEHFVANSRFHFQSICGGSRFLRNVG